MTKLCTFMPHEFRWIIMKLIEFTLQKQNWEIWKKILLNNVHWKICCLIMFILSARFQLENWSAAARLSSAQLSSEPSKIGLARAGKFQLGLITTVFSYPFLDSALHNSWAFFNTQFPIHFFHSFPQCDNYICTRKFSNSIAYLGA